VLVVVDEVVLEEVVVELVEVVDVVDVVDVDVVVVVVVVIAGITTKYRVATDSTRNIIIPTPIMKPIIAVGIWLLLL
jgi:hypothetical protein